jgi:hypothetical protein
VFLTGPLQPRITRDAADTCSTRLRVQRVVAFRGSETRAKFRVSGRFEVSHGMITVTASDGRTRTVEIEESMLGPETLAKVLLLQLHQAGRAAD